MKRFTLLMVALTWCCWFSPRQTNGAAVRIDLTALGQPGQSPAFIEITEVSRLPQSVLREFSNSMADPGKPFRVTDVDPTCEDSQSIFCVNPIPHRRLLIAAVSSQYCIVHYEFGGIVHSWVIALFKLSSDRALRVWVIGDPKSRERFRRPGLKSNLRELKATVESKELLSDSGGALRGLP